MLLKCDEIFAKVNHLNEKKSWHLIGLTGKSQADNEKFI